MIDGHDVTAPDAVTLEVSVFGPGTGESLAVHVGDGVWVIVDSCLDPTTSRPMALEYLERIGVDPGCRVKLVVASHWHDDHVAGLAETVASCEAARVALPDGLQGRRFRSLLPRDRSQPDLAARALRELSGVLEAVKERGRAIRWAGEGRLVLSSPAGSLMALAPSDAATESALEGFADMCSEAAPGRRLIARRPNHTSVVLWFEGWGTSMLLGGDLEGRAHNAGWPAVVECDVRPPTRAHCIKVPHHGSKRAFYSPVYEQLVEPDAIAIVTPNRRARLPTNDGIMSLCETGLPVYLTASREVEATLRPEIIDELDAMTAEWRMTGGAAGHVRARRSCEGREAWRVDLYGTARCVSAGRASEAGRSPS